MSYADDGPSWAGELENIDVKCESFDKVECVKG